ncbi:MAG: hypothetical protein ACPLSP_06730, partial [Fervidicoccus fontis]
LILFLVLFSVIQPFEVNIPLASESHDISYEINNENIELLTKQQFLRDLAIIKKVSLLNLELLDLKLTKKFESMHPEIFSNNATVQSSGYYQYMYISRDVNFGYTYGNNSIIIREVVPAKVYVNGSFRQFVYVDNPFTRPVTSGSYTWTQSYTHTFLDDPPISFDAMGSGYAEVAISSSLSTSIGVELLGNGFTLRWTKKETQILPKVELLGNGFTRAGTVGNIYYYRKVGNINYYRKICDFPTWHYSLYQ